jgi:hypothetical protein
MRKAIIIGAITAGLVATAAEAGPVCGRLARSAERFRQNFQDLERSGNSLSPVERFVFSLVLANSSGQSRPSGAMSEHRT